MGALGEAQYATRGEPLTISTYSGPKQCYRVCGKVGGRSVMIGLIMLASATLVHPLAVRQRIYTHSLVAVNAPEILSTKNHIAGCNPQTVRSGSGCDSPTSQHAMSHTTQSKCCNLPITVSSRHPLKCLRKSNCRVLQLLRPAPHAYLPDRVTGCFESVPSVLCKARQTMPLY